MLLSCENYTAHAPNETLFEKLSVGNAYDSDVQHATRCRFS